jgi:phosphatidylglycerol:prolipoprotein diacylglycerol transferase
MLVLNIVSAVIWDPERTAILLPYIDWPVAWYGILFATGFFLGYLTALKLITTVFNDREKAEVFTDRLVWYITAGMIIGARLGHVFFYDWEIYRHNLLSIPKIWEGGLASHGGALGVILALLIFCWRNREIRFLSLLDIVCVSTGIVGMFIRLGNFMNQEILGLPTTMPWGIIFGHPADGSFPEPRHPVQIYEAIGYFAIYLFLCSKWNRWRTYPGMCSGLFFILLFTFRFIIEWFKALQSLSMEGNSPLLMGQWLSIPFVILGIMIFYFSRSDFSLGRK